MRRLLLVVILVLSGCESGYQRAEQAREESLPRHNVYLVRLEDGTRCAIYREKTGYAGMGGISCDW